MRLFIAINFPQEVKKEIVSLRDDLRRQSERGTFTSSENLHLTLVFLGEVDSPLLPAVNAAMSEVKFPPLRLKITHQGRFPSRDGDIRWLGFEENKDLLKLQRDLTAALKSHGFQVDERPYKPHLTLGRRIAAPALKGKNPPLPEVITVESSKISLMLSRRIDGRLNYKELHTYKAIGE